jgi:spermidine dehydrogenase
LARADIARLYDARIDYMPGLSSQEKKNRLARMSYRDFLVNVAGADPGVVPFFQARTHDEWGVGIDAVSALDVWPFGFPGLQGLDLEPGAAPRMGFTASGYAATGGSEKFHFPDGNASIARLLVRSLVPSSIPGRSAEDIVTARRIMESSTDPEHRCASGSAASPSACATSANRPRRARPK